VRSLNQSAPAPTGLENTSISISSLPERESNANRIFNPPKHRHFRRNASLSDISFAHKCSDTLATDGWISFTPSSQTSGVSNPDEPEERLIDHPLLLDPTLFIRIEATIP